MSRHCRTAQLLVALSLPWTTWILGSAAETKKPISVADTIRMVTVPETHYAAEDTSKSRIALFSPDGRQFVIVVERGIVETNEREFSLLLFQTEKVFGNSDPEKLVTMRSRSNRDGIRNVSWLGNGRLVFLGETRGAAQVFALKIATKRLVQLTHHPAAIVDFAFHPKAKVLVYAAEPERLSREAAYERCARGYAITNQALDDIPRSLEDCREPSLLQGPQVFVQKLGQPAKHVEVPGFYLSLKPMSISPTGEFAIFAVMVRKVPSRWKEYEDPFIHKEAVAFRDKGPFSWLMQYMLIGTLRGKTRPLVDGPVDISQGAIVWLPNGKSVVVSGAFLPLDGTNSMEEAERKKQPFVVDVNLGNGEFSKVTSKQLIAVRWNAKTRDLFLRPPYRNPERGTAVYRKTGEEWAEVATEHIPTHQVELAITLEQGLNQPPQIFASDAARSEKWLLLDLNPQLKEFDLGRVERTTWKAKDGHEVEGGLYLPPHYEKGKRYPLVIQTHGFSAEEFWVNGPWNSAFAAQPLTAHDIVVLQVGYATTKGADANVAGTPEEAPRQMGVYEGAIDFLNGLGIIDPQRVGIIGFSRTVYWMEYTLTHSSYHFAAATAADGFDGGYVQYLVNPYARREWSTVNGGDPFGANFDFWREHSPSFTVDRVRTPVRLEGYGGISSVLGNWEWYAKLVMLDRPVDLIYIPDGTHLLVKPWERMTSEQGNVDWFRFWLKSEEDRDPRKQEQYERWRSLRAQLDQLLHSSAK